MDNYIISNNKYHTLRTFLEQTPSTTCNGNID